MAIPGIIVFNPGCGESSSGEGDLENQTVPVAFRDRLLGSEVEAPVVHSIVGSDRHFEVEANLKHVCVIGGLVVSEESIHLVAVSRGLDLVQNVHSAGVDSGVGVDKSLVVRDFVGVGVEGGDGGNKGSLNELIVHFFK